MRANMSNMPNMAKYAYLGAYLGAQNMVKWGIPEKILQNAVQTRWSEVNRTLQSKVYDFLQSKGGQAFLTLRIPNRLFIIKCDMEQKFSQYFLFSIDVIGKDCLVNYRPCLLRLSRSLDPEIRARVAQVSYHHHYHNQSIERPTFSHSDHLPSKKV